MSEVTQVQNDSNMQHNTYDTNKIFLRNIVTRQYTFNNDTGGVLSLKPGALLGKKASNGKLKALASGVNDGSQYAVGILMTEITDLADAADLTVNVVISGEVDEQAVSDNLNGADDLDTAVTNNGGKDIREVIMGDTAGVVLRESTDLTGSDNQ